MLTNKQKQALRDLLGAENQAQTLCRAGNLLYQLGDKYHEAAEQCFRGSDHVREKASNTELYKLLQKLHPIELS